MPSVTYDDGLVACDDSGILIRRYYPWGSSKRILYSKIRHVNKFEMTGTTDRWRIWGSGDFKHWWNLDTKRPGKHTALELDVGGRIVPTITPNDPDTVARIIAEHSASS